MPSRALPTSLLPTCTSLQVNFHFRGLEGLELLGVNGSDSSWMGVGGDRLPVLAASRAFKLASVSRWAVMEGAGEGVREEAPAMLDKE
jgi:hypothetical protein